MKKFLSGISPKVYVPVAIGVGAALALWALTGDSSYLVGVLVSLTGGVAGHRVEPAPRVTQEEVNRISRERRPQLGRRDPRDPGQP